MHFIFLFLALGGPIPCFASTPPTPQLRAPLLLGEGEQRFVHTPAEIERFTLSGDAFRALSPPAALHSPKTLLLRAQKPGTGELLVWLKSSELLRFPLRSFALGNDELPSLMIRELSALQEVEVHHASGHVLLRGEVRSLSETARIRLLKEAHGDKVRDFTQASADLMRRIIPRLREVQIPGGLAPEIREEQGRIRVSGHFPPERTALSRRWESALRAIYPLLDWDVEQLPPSGPMVFFRVYLLEVRKESMQSLGVRWPALVQSAFVLQPQQSPTATTSFEASLHALESQGGLKILSHPEIAVRSPGEAELFSGGEIPLRSHTRFQSTLQWKSFGLLLRLKVLETQGQRVRAEIQTEVSQLDHAISLDETPGIRSNRLKTQVDATLGAPLVLCGMIQESTRKKAQGLPGLSSIPVLGSLFGSQDYQEERSELLAVLIPHTQSRPLDPASIAEEFPRGPVPPPRNWISPSDFARIRNSKEFPWNAL